MCASTRQTNQNEAGIVVIVSQFQISCHYMTTADTYVTNLDDPPMLTMSLQGGGLTSLGCTSLLTFASFPSVDSVKLVSYARVETLLHFSHILVSDCCPPLRHSLT